MFGAAAGAQPSRFPQSHQGHHVLPDKAGKGDGGPTSALMQQHDIEAVASAAILE